MDLFITGRLWGEQNNSIDIFIDNIYLLYKIFNIHIDFIDYQLGLVITQDRKLTYLYWYNITLPKTGYNDTLK